MFSYPLVKFPLVLLSFEENDVDSFPHLFSVSFFFFSFLFYRAIEHDRTILQSFCVATCLKVTCIEKKRRAPLALKFHCDNKGPSTLEASCSQCRKAIKYQFHRGHLSSNGGYIRWPAIRGHRDETGRSFSNLHGTVSITKAILKHHVRVTRKKDNRAVSYCAPHYRRYCNSLGCV